MFHIILDPEAWDHMEVPDTKTITKPTIYCTYCSELAAGYNSQGQPMCGAIGDHPGCDEEIVTELNQQ